MKDEVGARAPLRTAPYAVLAGIILAYLVIAAQYAIRTPAWQVPDEPAHYNYVRYVVERRSLPVLQPGDYDQAFNERFTDPANTPDLPIDPMRYEFHQPPLYYLLAAPVYALTGGNLVALRLVSVLLGGALIAVSFFAAREACPQRLDLALGAAALVAFVPQHVAMMAGVNNDSLAELLLALALLQTIRVLKGGTRRGFITLGMLLGLGFITKTTNYLAAPVALVALLFSRRTSPSTDSAGLVLRSAFVFVPAVVIGSVWWLRNLSVYGGFDVLGLARHNAVVVGQPLTADWIARLGVGPFLLSALTTTFHSFWGQFGWMGVPMPDGVYLGLGALSVIALLGWLSTLRPGQASRASLLLALLTLSTFAAYAWYNLTFVQHQGRYLFPALIPLGLVFSIGIDRWTRLLPRRFGIVVYAGVFATLAALDLYALYRFVVPSLSG